MSEAPASTAALARIAGHAVAISAELDQLLGHVPTDEAPVDKLGQALVEMHAMSRLLAETRAEVVGLAPPPTDFGDVLDAVVADTEDAALEILRQAERAQAAAGRLQAGGRADAGMDVAGDAARDAKADLVEVEAAAAAIVMACAFQDITGQRVRKVLSTMRQVELRVAALVALLGISADETAAGSRPLLDQRPDAHLLNGPSTVAQGGLHQTAVDDLFG